MLSSFDDLRQLWNNPPAESRPILRWWWPGGAVNRERMIEELRMFEAAGFGGVEIQPFAFGFSRKDLAADPRVRTVGNPEFLATLKTAIDAGHNMGLEVHLTLGSGWPSGGPFATDASEMQFLFTSVDISGDGSIGRSVDRSAGTRQDAPGRQPTTIPMPIPRTSSYHRITNLLTPGILGPFDTDMELVAVVAARLTKAGLVSRIAGVLPRTVAFVAERLAGNAVAGLIDITASADIRARTVTWQAPAGHWRLFALWKNRTNHRIFGDAYTPEPGRNPLVIDHLDRAGATALTDGLARPWLDAIEPSRPDSIFVDSPELIAELAWTDRFADAFSKAKGYDITPYLPLRFRPLGESKYVEALTGYLPSLDG